VSALDPTLEAPVLEWVGAVRRLNEAGPLAAARWRIVEAVTVELRRRVGATFTLPELVKAYYAAGDWYTELAARTVPSVPEAWDASIALDAAFGLYSRAARPGKAA
jgi:hypothetical protein